MAGSASDTAVARLPLSVVALRFALEAIAFTILYAH
ncbi:protein of unknown function (plasmid) [Cupriavidus taiwanensis]|uniref:Uncharacterized protein n=1 Tax=Cupriavidus taiwanensis TaxID=164546 RepID=A0A9Q7XTY3_9BURK|nr:protein of unknown function [Cupriavidus taiwanensis]